jgi:hypothetical protein
VASTGVPWLPQDHELLLKLAGSGASQVEIAKAFPGRTWKAIFNKYRVLAGRNLSWGRRNNQIREHETYHDYLKRTENVGTPDTKFEVSS